MQYPGSIASFNGGLVDDLREPQTNRFGLSKHFDIFTNPFRLTPYRSTVAEQTSVSAADFGLYHPRNFQLGKDGKMYAMGDNKSGLAQVLSKADPATTGNWSLPATAVGTGIVVYGSFLEWGTTSAFYMFTGTQAISKWQVGGTFTNSVLALGVAITSVAQSVIGADDNMYMFYNNRVVRVTNAGVASDNVLTNLPSNMRIVSVARWGTYLAIGMAYGTSAIASPTGPSKVFIWDMVTTTTVNDCIDWGEGALRVLGNVEGQIVGVSDKFLTTPAGLTSLAVGQGSMVVRIWNGTNSTVFKEIIANQSVPADSGTYDNVITRFPHDVVIKDNKMYWVASVPLYPDSTATESTYNLGIWAFGRKNSSLPYAVTLDYIEQAVDTANYYINSFGSAGNYWFLSYSAAGLVNRTDNTATYTFTSIFESPIFNFIFGLRHKHINDSSEVKKLQGVTITTDPLPTGATVVLKYRKDVESAWTTIFSHGTVTGGSFLVGVNYTILSVGTTDFTLIGATANTIGVSFVATGAGSGSGTANQPLNHSAINIESTGATLPEYKEVQFRIESTGGAIITGFKFIFEQQSKDLY